MNKNNGLPASLSDIEDGQHVVLDVPIWERLSNMFGPFTRPPSKIDPNYDYKLAAIFVIIGTHPGQNQNIPLYCRVSSDNLTGNLSLLDIEEDKTIITVGGKIIEIFRYSKK